MVVEALGFSTLPRTTEVGINIALRCRDEMCWATKHGVFVANSHRTLHTASRSFAISSDLPSPFLHAPSSKSQDNSQTQCLAEA